MELFLYCFLILETKKEIRLDALFKEYKSYLKDKSNFEMQSFLNRLSDLAKIYYKLPQGGEIHELKFKDVEKRFFHVLENLEITTIFPLVLYLYKNVSNEQDLLKCLNLLESFLALRQVCQFTTKNYNKIFIQIIRTIEKYLPNGDNSIPILISDILKEVLYNFNDFGNRLPTEIEIKNAFHKNILSNKQAGEILFIIALYDIDSEYSDTKTLSSKSFSVEHIMPKMWEENWPDASLDDLGKFRRNNTLLTLGNLTLITKNLNSKLRNQAWESKKETLKDYSSLKMTTSYLGNEQWNEETIVERANQLFDKAMQIWKY
jgi:hypothetical protein